MLSHPLRRVQALGHADPVLRFHLIIPCILVCTACGPESHPAPAPLDLPEPLVQPDIVLVTLDTVRADRFSCYGYPRETSPHLDQLAKTSVRFERCLAPAPTTLPSHTSMFTGLEPLEHGVLANLHEGLVYERHPDLLTLTETLQQAGYTTAGFVSAQPLRKETGIGAGFETWSEPRRPERPGFRTMDKALEWLNETEGPLFLWVHLFDPHNPYQPQEPWDQHFDASDGVVGAWMKAHGVQAETTRLGGRKVDMHAANEAYDGELRATDEELGRLLTALGARPRWDQTILAVIGDHGEGLGQHGEPSHGLAWDDHLHVPWVMRIPGLAPLTIGETVSVTDFLPTLLGRIHTERASDLLDQCSGIDRLKFPGLSTPVHGQSSPRQSAKRLLDHAWTEDPWKYLRLADGTELLFDLEQDPFEFHDQAGVQPEVLGRLRSGLDQHLERLARYGEARTRRATPEEEANLRALGYGGGEVPSRDNSATDKSGDDGR